MPDPRAPLSHAADGQGFAALAVSVALHAAVAVPLLMPHPRPVAAPELPRTMDLILISPEPPAVTAPVAAAVPVPAPAARPAKVRPAPAAKPAPAPAAQNAEPAAVETTAGNGTAPTPAPESGGGGPAMAAPPGYSLGAATTPAPDYPWSARRRGIEGRVVLRLEVGADGLPTGIELVHSSGSDALDQAAMAALRQWRLRPALADGVPVAGRVVVPIVFKLT